MKENPEEFVIRIAFICNRNNPKATSKLLEGIMNSNVPFISDIINQ